VPVSATIPDSSESLRLAHADRSRRLQEDAMMSGNSGSCRSSLMHSRTECDNPECSSTIAARAFPHARGCWVVIFCSRSVAVPLREEIEPTNRNIPVNWLRALVHRGTINRAAA